jgi:putative ABC transport system permease protein
MAWRIARSLADLTIGEPRGAPIRFAALAVLAAAPLVALLWLKLAVVDGIAEQFRDDPAWREIIHEGNRKFTDAWFAEMRARPDVAFVVPLTRALSREVDVGLPGDQEHFYGADLVVTGHGDPRLGDPRLGGLADKVGPGTAVISERLSRRARLHESQDISVWAARPTGGVRPRPEIRLRVAGVAPADRSGRNEVFVPLDVARDIEDVNVGIAVPERGWSGQPRPAARAYASFRVAARDIDDVPELQQALLDRDLNVSSEGALAAEVFALDRTLTLWFWPLTICGVLSLVLTAKANRRLADWRLTTRVTQPDDGNTRRGILLLTMARAARIALAGTFAVSLVVLLALGWRAWSAAAAFPHPATEDVLESVRCADLGNVLNGSCSRGQLAGLAPEQATRIATRLLSRGGKDPNELALALLQQAWVNDHYATAGLELAELYDPLSFARSGPLTEPNPARALELYGDAAAAGATEASERRTRLIEQLRTVAAGNGPDARGAGDALRGAGIQ